MLLQGPSRTGAAEVFAGAVPRSWLPSLQKAVARRTLGPWTSQKWHRAANAIGSPNGRPVAFLLLLPYLLCLPRLTARRTGKRAAWRGAVGPSMPYFN